MTDDAFPEVPGYRFEAKLAEGGMGVVYRAVDDTLGRTVAIKMIRSALLGRGDEEEETVARFLREARAAAQIRSNHVAHVLQFGRTDKGDLFLVLEYLDGVTLADVLRKEKRISVERAVRITRQICRGMEAAHQLGIVHRDLKPSNVMLVDQDGDSEFVKILDFGVAKVVGERESGVTRAGMLVGTYTCMAPEQVTNETIDARTDVYALAVMLFRLLTGRPLFEGNDVTAVLFHHVHTPAPAPSKVAPDAKIPPALDAVVLRCLEKDPGRRPRSMADFDRALGHSLELAGDAEGELVQTPTPIAASHDVTHANLGDTSRAPTLEADGEVFAESGPIDSRVDPREETQVADSSSLLAAPSGDPPTPNTSTGAKEPASLEALHARTGEPLAPPSVVAPAAPTRKPLVAAAVAAALLLIVGGVVALLGGDDAEEDVVVVVTPAEAAEPPAPDEGPSAQAPPPADAPSDPPPDPPEPVGEEAGEPATQEPTADDDEALAEPAATPPKATAAPEEPERPAVQRPKQRRAVEERTPSASSSDEQRRRKAARKRAPPDPTPAAKAEPADAEDQKPRPRFIRVRTGEDG